MRRFFSPLPDPDDRSPAPLRPHKRVSGIYRLHREPMDTEVLYEEPDGTSYALEFFEAEATLRVLLRIREDQVNRILDLMWEFHHCWFDIGNPDIVVPFRSWPPSSTDLHNLELAKSGTLENQTIRRIANAAISGRPVKVSEATGTTGSGPYSQKDKSQE